MKQGFYALKLSVVCILVFLLQIFVSGFTDMFLLDSNYVFEFWRFLTSIFLHSGVPHLLYNLFALALFGSILEGTLGSKKFLFIFFSTGIFANLIAVNFYDSSLGASGAIFGVIGALISIRPKMMVWAFGLPMPMVVAGALWIAGDIIGIFFPSNVGNIAHLAGVFLGIVIGFLFKDKRNQRIEENIDFDESEVRRWEDFYLR